MSERLAAMDTAGQHLHLPVGDDGRMDLPRESGSFATALHINKTKESAQRLQVSQSRKPGETLS